MSNEIIIKCIVYFCNDYYQRAIRYLELKKRNTKMPKRSHFLRWLNRCNYKFLPFCLTVTMYLCYSGYYEYGRWNYPHISKDVIDPALYKEVIPTVWTKGLPNCTYDDVLGNTQNIISSEIPELFKDFDAEGIANGSFSPPHCNPLFSVALLVTYRNRHEHLKIFLPHMHNFLRKQNIHYKIYLIEQQDDKPWNKGLLYNIGARHAIADGFPCLILQDVDLLPLDRSNLYACTKDPRHLSASIEKYHFMLPYDWLIGGVLAIRADQYEEVNGFSNRFLNWGGEDDDFYMRLLERDIGIIRFSHWMSRYTNLLHAFDVPVNERGEDILRRNRLDSAAERAADGYALSKARSVQVHEQRLFTLIAVHT